MPERGGTEKTTGSLECLASGKCEAKRWECGQLRTSEQKTEVAEILYDLVYNPCAERWRGLRDLEMGQ